MIEPATPAFWRATLALSLGSILVFANLYISQPLIPLLRDQFALSDLQATYSLTLATLSLGLSLLIWGPLSDVLGRRAIMIITLAGAILCTRLISQVSNYDELLCLRIVQGFLLGGLPAIAVAYFGDEFNRRALLLAVGFYISGNSLGGIAGRLLGGFIADMRDWPSAFTWLALISFVGLILFAWLLPPSQQFTPQPLKPRQMLQDLSAHLSNPLLNTAYLIGGLNFFIFANQYSFVTLLLAEPPFSLPPSWLGMLFLTYLSGSWGSVLAGKAAQRIDQPHCMLLGIVLMATGSLTTLFGNLSGVIGGLLISSFGFFFCHSSASSWVNRHAERARASASSLYLVAYYLGASGGSLYLSLFWQPWHWQGVVGGSLLILAVTALLSQRLAQSARTSLAVLRS